jgi:hypothetical protein
MVTVVLAVNPTDAPLLPAMVKLPQVVAVVVVVVAVVVTVTVFATEPLNVPLVTVRVTG